LEERSGRRDEDAILYRNPRHAAARLLLSAYPLADPPIESIPAYRTLIESEGEVTIHLEIK
jgi:hypothetical protein